MIQLSSPTRVVPPSCTVPRLMVTHSRMVLPLPIWSAVSSPAYFLSCGAAPTEQKGYRRLFSPSVVGPSSTTCAPTLQPAPMRTRGPMTA